jgi:hypothetical protein
MPATRATCRTSASAATRPSLSDAAKGIVSVSCLSRQESEAGEGGAGQDHPRAARGVGEREGAGDAGQREHGAQPDQVPHQQAVLAARARRVLPDADVLTDADVHQAGLCEAGDERDQRDDGDEPAEVLDAEVARHQRDGQRREQDADQVAERAKRAAPDDRRTRSGADSAASGSSTAGETATDRLFDRIGGRPQRISASSSAVATRSRSCSVSREWKGSASARSKQTSAPGKDPCPR